LAAVSMRKGGKRMKKEKKAMKILKKGMVKKSER
jgi:hypothetical protein